MGQLVILKDRCKSCMFCIEFCPFNVLKESDDKTQWGRLPEIQGECKGCRVCEHLCPDFAIFYDKKGG